MTTLLPSMNDLTSEWGTVDDLAQDPTAWMDKNGEFVWSRQREILESVKNNRYTAVHSAHDMGKSFIASRVIAHFIDTHPVGEAFVVSTAPTAAQVSAIMWREVTKIHKKAKLLGQINRAGYPQWIIDGELVGYGRKPADYQQSAFQGIHAKYVLVVIDEACGVTRHLYDSIDALATNENARVLAIGNPDDPGSHFASICKPGSPSSAGWNVIHLDGLRSPNMTRERIVGDDPENPKWPLVAAMMEAEGVPYSVEEVPDDLRPMLIDERWISERIERWAGVPIAQAEILDHPALVQRVRSAAASSALFTSKVRGIFPETASEGIIPLGWVQRAMDRWDNLNQKKNNIREARRNPSMLAHEAGAKIIGADIARQGDDETVFAHRYGSYVTHLERMHIADTMEVAERLAAHLHEPGSVACIDVIGIGSGVYDRIRQMRGNGEITGEPVPFNASKNSHRRDMLGQFKFRNDRAAAWWNLRELLDPSRGSMLALPNDEHLLEELVAPKFKLHAGGIMTVEEKDEIKRRLGRSTDAADAVIAAFWVNGPTNVEGIPYTSPAEDAAWAQRGGGVHGGNSYAYEGYNPFTDDDMSAGLGLGRLGGLSGSPLGQDRYTGNDTDWSI